MATATFVDTSVLCEFLAVPGKSQRPDEIRQELRERVAARESLLLPVATIIETGNHIAQLGGGPARTCAMRLAHLLRMTAAGEAPWELHGITWNGELLNGMCDGVRGALPLEDMAMQGVGTGDVSILAEAEAYRRRVAHVDVRIWTLDAGLAAYA